MVVFFSALENTGIVLTLICPEEEVVDESEDWGDVDESEEGHGTWRELSLLKEKLVRCPPSERSGRGPGRRFSSATTPPGPAPGVRFL